MASGVATLWNKGEWTDHENRINIAKASGDSVDALCVLPEDFQVVGKGWGRYIAAGAGDGKVRIVKMGSNSVVETLAHSLTAEEVKAKAAEDVIKGDYERVIEEGVAALGIDCDGRIVSGGGSVVRIWYWEDAAEEEEVDKGNKKKRRMNGSDSEEAEDSGGESNEEDSSEDEREKKKKKRKKKRKGGKGKAKSVGVKAVASFKGLD